MFDFSGMIPPMATPFDQNGAILYDRFERNIDRYLEAGVEGFLVAGSNGESVFLEHSEKLKLIEAARKRIPSSKMLLAGTGLESTQATIDLTRQAADLGVDGVLVKNPFYYKPMMTLDVCRAHYTAVADASSVPVAMYNIPAFTGISLEAKLVIELAKHPKILGVKESAGDVRLISEIVWNTDPGKFAVLAGAAPVLLANMVMGARGGIVALACAAPKALLALYRAVKSGDLNKAGAIQRIITPAAVAVTGRYGIPGLKAAMALEGYESGFPRKPLRPVSQAEGEDLEQIFRRMNSELAEIS